VGNTLRFLSFFVRGGKVPGFFGPPPGAGRLRNNETIVRLGGFQSHVYAILFRDSKQNQIHQPPGHTMWGDGITLPLESPPLPDSGGSKTKATISIIPRVGSNTKVTISIIPRGRVQNRSDYFHHPAGRVQH
jgi:hypothetical protein